MSENLEPIRYSMITEKIQEKLLCFAAAVVFGNAAVSATIIWISPRIKKQIFF